MTEERSEVARRVLAGLAPSRPHGGAEEARERGLLARGMHATVPIVVAGSIAVSVHLTGPVAPADAAQPRPREERPMLPAARPAAAAPVVAAPVAATGPAPASYRVQPGDTVSSIAGRFGLSTASVLALNGLGWKSVIYPGQVLALTSAAPRTSGGATSTGGSYTIARGDTLWGISQRFSVSLQALLARNGLQSTSIIYPGQTIAIPGPSDVLAVQTTAAVTATSTPVASSPAPALSSVYTIRAGDTISSIAAAYRVGVQDVLRANGLTWSSVIYPGRTLVIPGIDPAAAGDGITPLTAEMRANASVVVAVGRELGVPDRGIVVALAAAMQESGLRNVDHGDRDSVGLFQQRPSTGWGSRSALLDADHAARLFYGGPRNPNAGRTRGLLDIPGWQSMTITQAAQAVQISAHPDAYAKWEKSARAWLAELG